jgi:hypothetical protein
MKIHEITGEEPIDEASLADMRAEFARDKTEIKPVFKPAAQDVNTIKGILAKVHAGTPITKEEYATLKSYQDRIKKFGESRTAR